MRAKFSLLILVMLILGGCSALKSAEFQRAYGPVQGGVDRLVAAHTIGEVSFVDDVQPILERRCSVCHSCYDAPLPAENDLFRGY